MPAPEDVLALIKDLLPPPTEVFTAALFKQPLLAPAILYDNSSYYSCHNIEEALEDSTNMSERDKRNINIKTMTWLPKTLVLM